MRLLMVALHSTLMVHMMPTMASPRRGRLLCRMMIPTRTTTQAQLWSLLRIQIIAKSLPSATETPVLRKEAGLEVALSVASRGAEVIAEARAAGQAEARLGRNDHP